MAITVCWLDETQTVVFYSFAGKWDWNELVGAMGQANALMGTVPHPVDVIADLSGSLHLPVNLLEMGRNAAKVHRPANMGMVVVVQGGAFLEPAVNVMRRIYRELDYAMRYVNSLDEARAAIVQVRAARTTSSDG
ncbi:MAG: hypothetical protein JW910_22525 [Anaerolineae bacterium]|nr:hypothetical protein [Anaerolineae bacterium]